MNIIESIKTVGYAVVDTSHFFKIDYRLHKYCTNCCKACHQGIPQDYISFCKNIFNKIEWRVRFEEGLVERDGGSDIQKFHKDGCAFRTICVLKGPGTIYIDSKSEKKIVPNKYTLFITGLPSEPVMPATWHRRPKTKKPRIVIIGTTHYRENLISREIFG